MSMLLRSLFVVLAACAANTASAHTPSTAHLMIDAPRDAARISVELDVAVRDLALTLALDANGDSQVTWSELSAQRGAIESSVQRGLEIRADGSPCALEPDALRVRRYEQGAYAALAMHARCAAAPSAIEVRYGLLFDEDPRHRVLVELRQDGAASLEVATASRRTLAFEQGGTTASTFRPFLLEGVRHILIGYDHLAFLVLLLLPIGLARKGHSWMRERSLRVKAWQAAALVTAFTAAHSITLSLAALGIVVPPQRPVEILIALTVVLAAANNVRPVVTRHLWALAFAFGLLHGFGFAGALAELGLPADRRVVPLLGFNLGVELGQLLVLAFVLPVLHALQAWKAYPRAVLAPASMLIGAVGLFWLVQRVPA